MTEACIPTLNAIAKLNVKLQLQKDIKIGERLPLQANILPQNEANFIYNMKVTRDYTPGPRPKKALISALSVTGMRFFAMRPTG